MSGLHEDKVALVTGGSRGIGRAVVRELVAEGAHVVVVARRPDGLSEIARELGERVTTMACHVADQSAAQECVRAAVERHGRVDLLVNNAAVSVHWGAALEVDAGMAAKMAEVNLWAPLLWSRLISDAGMGRTGGAIVNIASVGGIVATPNTGYYNATKAGLIHLTRSLAAELSPQIRVNVVAPGLIDTDMAKSIPAAERPTLEAQVPLGRLGQPEDIAHAVSFLLSDRASWITGEVMVVDGGTRHRAARRAS